jgi:Rad3-related DNA helicase
MGGFIKQVTTGIILAFMLGAAYNWNDIYRDEFKREEELSLLKKRQEDLDVKLKTSEAELLSLKMDKKASEHTLVSLKIPLQNLEVEHLSLNTVMEELAEEMDRMKNISPSK